MSYGNRAYPIGTLDMLRLPPRPKIEGGTPLHSVPSLCATCKWSFKMKGQTLDQDYVKCNAINEWITFKVSACQAHHPYNQPTLDEMFPIAWMLVTRKNKREIGFMRLKDMSDEEQQKFHQGNNNF